MSRLILSLMMVALTTSCANGGQLSDVCPSVSSVIEIPFRDVRGADLSYNKLRYDTACDKELKNSLTSLVPMKDPRQMPLELRLVEGDTALFILLRRNQIDVLQILPEELKNNWNSQGMATYFEYVSTYKNRLQIIDRLNQLISQK